MTYSVVGVEDVGGGRVVQDEHLVEVSAQTTQVLHVVSPMEHAGLPEETTAERAPFIQKVRHRICILTTTNTIHGHI